MILVVDFFFVLGNVNVESCDLVLFLVICFYLSCGVKVYFLVEVVVQFIVWDNSLF